MPWPRGRSPIASRSSVIDPARDEALQLAAVLVEDADRGVARAGQLAGDAQQLLEHGVDLELGHQPAAGLQQRREAGFVERPELHGGDSSIRGNPQAVRGVLRWPAARFGADAGCVRAHDHTTPYDHTSPTTRSRHAGAGLLPVFAIAVVVATIAISAVVAAPGTITLIVALACVIGFGAGIVALLSRLIGPEQH